MQRLAPWMLLITALAFGSATQAEPLVADYIINLNNAAVKPIVPRLPPPIPAASPVAVPINGTSTSVPSPAVAPAVLPAAVPSVAPMAAATIAVLLPTESPELGGAAKVILQGINAAQRTDNGPAIVRFDTSGSDVLARYHAALAAGAQVVIGPLSRPEIALVAPMARVPTLVLNTLDVPVLATSKAYSLNLALESEAREVAALMFADGHKAPLVLLERDAPLETRVGTAFSAAWRALSGQTPPQRYIDDAAYAPALSAADSVFLAQSRAEAIPELGGKPHYSTSQLDTQAPPWGALIGLKVVDMPWFLRRDEPAVARYPRPGESLTLSTEKLYALGIDAYRLAVLLLNNTAPPAGLHLDGVTGDLTLYGHTFRRQLPDVVLELKP